MEWWEMNDDMFYWLPKGDIVLVDGHKININVVITPQTMSTKISYYWLLHGVT